MPSSSAACFSPSPSRCTGVHADPSPRERRASMKLHTAGSSEPQNDADMPAGAPSGRPSRHGINMTGTSWGCSLRYVAEVVDAGPLLIAHVAVLGLGQIEVRGRVGPVDLGKRGD